MTLKNWAPDWKTTQPPQKEQLIDAFSAEFEDASGNRVKVRITAQDLKRFEQAPLTITTEGPTYRAGLAGGLRNLCNQTRLSITRNRCTRPWKGP